MKYWFECWRKFAVFSGRARCYEYWSFVFLNIAVILLVPILVVAVCKVCGFPVIVGWDIVFLIVYLPLMYLCVVILPGMAVTVRRLHDTGKSGLNLLWMLIPLGPLILLCFLCRAGDKGRNAYGDDPKEIKVAGVSSVKGTVLFFLVILVLAGYYMRIARPWARRLRADNAKSARSAAVAWHNSVNDVIGGNVDTEEAFAALKSTLAKLSPLDPGREATLKRLFNDSCGHMKEWTAGCEDFGTNWSCTVAALLDSRGTNFVLCAGGARGRLISELGKSVENLTSLSRHVTADLEATHEILRWYGEKDNAGTNSVTGSLRSEIILMVDCRNRQVKVLKSLSELDPKAIDYGEREKKLLKEYDDLDEKFKRSVGRLKDQAREYGIGVTKQAGSSGERD